MALTTPMFSSLIGSRTILLSIIVCFAFTTSSAQTLRFSTPVAGTLGKDVFLVNHVDHDTTQGEFRNYNCKPYTYDGHDGTDFVLKSFRHMDSGVAVLAAADGVVTDVADTLYDRNKESIVARGYGNYITIKHIEGYVSHYAHIRTHSARVVVGQRVKRGDAIAMVGNSGNSTDPHVHFEVWRRVDPFAGQCADKTSLWIEQQDITEEHSVVDHDVTTWPPMLDTIRERPPHADAIDQSANTITAWSLHTGVKKTDVFTINWYTPEGKQWFGYEAPAGITTNYFYWWSFIDYTNGTMPKGKWKVEVSMNGVVVCRDSFMVTATTSVHSPASSTTNRLVLDNVTEIHDLDGNLVSGSVYELPDGTYHVYSKSLSSSMLVIIRNGVICGFSRRSKNSD